MLRHILPDDLLCNAKTIREKAENEQNAAKVNELCDIEDTIEEAAEKLRKLYD